jgi:hypothetical protein
MLHNHRKGAQKGEKPMKRLILLAAAASLLAVGTAYAQPTRDQYIAQADPICAGSMRAEARALSGLGSDLKKGRLKRAGAKFRAAGSAISTGIDELATLAAPPEDSALISSWLTSLRSEIPIINRFARSLSKGQARKVGKVYKQLKASVAASEDIVQSYGFTVCNSFGE